MSSISSISSKPTLMDVQHEFEENEVFEDIPEGGTSVQEAVEYAFGMMVKRLPDKTTGDNFIHDLQFKGLSREEAEKQLDKLTDEGPLGYDEDGWLVKI
jgi:hypothetical protein